MLKRVLVPSIVLLLFVGISVLAVSGLDSALAGNSCSKKTKKAGASAAAAGCTKGTKASSMCSKASAAASAACSKMSGSAKSACCSKQKAANASASIQGVSTDMPWHESKRIVLTGSYVCGKCSLSKLDFCQGFLKTSEGSLFPLMTGLQVNKMKMAAHSKDAKGFEVVSKVRIINGVKYLQVRNFTNL